MEINMELQIVIKTGRSVVVELTDSGKYYSEKKYDIYVNGGKFMESDKVITSLYGLKPDTEYTISAVYDGKEIAPVSVRTDYEFVTLNVKDFGAYGNGEHDDTNAIQCAIMACPKAGRILVPAGEYKISSIFLKSDITLDLAKGAVLSAFTEREKFPILPGVIESYDETDEYNLGSWEGNPLDCFSAIVCGINVENVVITGEGTIDGSALAIFIIPDTSDLSSVPMKRRPLHPPMSSRTGAGVVDYFFSLLSTTSLRTAVKASSVMAPRSPSARLRGETVPASISRSPTTSI